MILSGKRSLSSVHLDVVRFHTMSGTSEEPAMPSLSRQPAMPSPIIPSPMKPIGAMVEVVELVLSVDLKIIIITITVTISLLLLG